MKMLSLFFSHIVISCVFLSCALLYSQRQSINHYREMQAHYETRMLALEDQLIAFSNQFSSFAAKQNTSLSVSRATSNKQEENSVEQPETSTLSTPVVFQEEETQSQFDDDKNAEAMNDLAIRDFRAQREMDYQQDTRDESWASTQEQNIENLLASEEHFKGIDLYYVDCKSVTCRVELFVSEEAPKHAEPMLTGLVGRELPNASWQREGNILTLQFSQ